MAVFSNPLPKVLSHSRVIVSEGFILSGRSPKSQESIDGGFPFEETEKLSLISG